MQIRALKGIFFATIAAVLTACQLEDAGGREALNASLQRIEGEHAIQTLWISSGERYRPADHVIYNANIVDVADGSVTAEQGIVVRNGVISWVGPEGDLPPATDLAAYDANGAFITPGLVDMHVHTMEHDRDFLLHLVNGVTAVREMDGFGYHFGRRAMARSGMYLMPLQSVSSMILNSSDFGGYAIALDTPHAAREAVRAQAALGAESIKVHNGLARDVYLAIADEAASVGLALVGHIPVRVSIQEAVDAGQLTNEHFKGLIRDDRLTITEDDYASIISGSGLWNTPTFNTYREHLRGDDVDRIMASFEAELIAPYERASWAARADLEVDPLTEARQRIRPMSEEIFRNLMAVDAGFLAGTDSGSYELMLSGYALLEELETLQGLGLSPLQTLQTATLNAYGVLNWQDRHGRVAAGYAADFVITTSNPLENVSALREPLAVMVAGRLLDSDARQSILAGIRDIYATDYDFLTEDNLRVRLGQIVADMQLRHAAGFVYRDNDLELRAELAHNLGLEGLAAEIVAMGYQP